MTPAINFRLFSYFYRQDSLIAGVVDTAEKFIAGVVDTAEQFIAGVVDTADKHSFAIISANFRKKVEMILMDYSGARGTLIHEKKLRSKISCQTPFKRFTNTGSAPESNAAYPLLHNPTTEPPLLPFCARIQSPLTGVRASFKVGLKWG